jgi:hypothetical protein
MFFLNFLTLPLNNEGRVKSLKNILITLGLLKKSSLTTKYTKVNTNISPLCDLCESTS